MSCIGGGFSHRQGKTHTCSKFIVRNAIGLGIGSPAKRKAVIAAYGETTVLAAAVSAESAKPGTDFSADRQ